MSIVTAAIDEPAACDDVTMNELNIIAPVNNPVETIKAKFVPTADLEENQSNDLIELTNATNLNLASATNNYQVLTNASIEHESLTNTTNATTYGPQSSHSFDSFEPSTSGDYQLIIPSNDHYESINVAVDQELLTNDVQQPTTNVGGNSQLPLFKSANTVNQQPPVDTTEKRIPPASQPVSVKKPKSDSTPPRPWQIPPHLFGRDLNNPNEDLPGPNKRIPKPRPGVKVPYRNLTSQIVSRSELAQEILERQMRKNLYTEGLSSGDMFFAMKLTHRLANKISSNESVDKKSQEGAKSVTTTAANVIVPKSSDSVTKTVPAKSTQNSSTEPVTVTASTNVIVKPTTPDKTATAITNAIPATIPTNSVAEPTSSAGAELRLTSDSGDADQLYAEISSTLNEDYNPTATPVQIFSTADLQAQSRMKAANILNGSIRTEDELDNDTLLAILEGTTDEKELGSATDMILEGTTDEKELSSATDMILEGTTDEKELSSATDMILDGTTDEKELSSATDTAPTTPQSAIIATSTPIPELSWTGKKRKRLVLDPNLEKELALKQLMDFERKRKDKNANNTAVAKAKVAAKPASSQNGVVTPVKNTTPIAIKESEPAVTVADSPKQKIKRSSITYKVGSQAPKRFPKKYQRIIKQQLRSSKKQKTKNNSSPELQPQQQKKLPEVPEVQIAIDRFIKTYTSKKRKLKPDHQSTEKPAVKRMKTDAAVPNATDVAAANEDSATANEEAASINEKTAAADAKVVAVSDKIAKVAAVAKKATSKVASAAREKANVAREKAIVAREKAAATEKSEVASAIASEKATGTVATAPVPMQPSSPARQPIEVPDTVVVEEQNEMPEEEEEDSELEENESKGALTQSKENMKVMREINRLLGDEGAINMIYSVEQKRIPGGKRDTNVLPSVRRQKKDLQLRTKLVKNAVLRLSMSSSSQGTPTRNVRRSQLETSPDAATGTLPPSKGAAAAALRKVSIESVESTTSELNNNSSCSSMPARGTKTRQLAAEASRIIRRHSSSSAYSSDDEEEAATELKEKSEASITGETAVVDTPNQAATEECIPPKVSVETVAAVVEKKESRRSSGGSKTKSPSSSRRSSKDALASAAPNENRVLQVSALNGSLGSELFDHHLSLKEITVRKYDNLVQIILISSSTKMKNALNIDILRELICVLKELEKDDSCRTVLVTSTGSSFCQGIDLQTLISADKKERTEIVNEFVNTLMSFTKCLSQFRKILIAGVHGSAVGLGVTMLPFFDMVFASDKATFYTPYVKLGQIPEAGATLTLPHLLGNAVTSELLFGCRMLTASEALQFGLVTRILWPDKFTEELLPLARGISSHSSRAMEATKLLLRQGMTAKLEEQFEMEAKLLREHWCSEECQSSFKNYLDQEALLQNK